MPAAKFQKRPLHGKEAATTGRFTGKTFIVTGAGAGSGIGQATALRIAREGGRVIAADISKERLDALVAENADLDLVPVSGDISTEETIAAGRCRRRTR